MTPPEEVHDVRDAHVHEVHDVRDAHVHEVHDVRDAHAHEVHDVRDAHEVHDVRDAHEVHDVRVVLPAHLRTLAGVGREVSVEVVGEVTQRRVLDVLESRFPALGGTIRDRATARRRPFVRFFACEEDLSHDPPDAPLPEAVASGQEAFVVLGAIAGG